MNNNLFNLDDKVALVVGGRGRLGMSFCDILSNFGARVYSADITERNNTKDIQHKQVLLDVTSEKNVDEVVRNIIDEETKIDIMIYSVTAKPKDFFLPFTECSLEGWQKILAVELDGLFLVSKIVGQHMEQKGSGKVIFISSIYGVVGNDQRIYEGSNLGEVYCGEQTRKQIFSHAGYSAVKGAIISITRYLASYWGNKGIRVNCISPGGISNSDENETFVQRYNYRVPLGRKATEDDISSAVLYLASDASKYITGHNLVIDGGLTIW